MTFLDANIFVRFLAPGDERQGAACRALFRAIDTGKVDATTSEAIVAEIVYVLGSTRGASYGVTRHDIVARLRPLLTVRGLTIPNKPAVLQALDLFEAQTFLDFADVLAIALTDHLGLDSITSFDHDFDRIVGVRRVEPGDGTLEAAA